MNDYLARNDDDCGAAAAPDGIPRAWWLRALVALGFIAVLPMLGQWIRSGGSPRCAWDGLSVVSSHQVRVVEDSRDSVQFCCVTCAELWLRMNAASNAAIFVAAEETGEEIPANEAYFVRSTVVTNRVNGNRIHAFESSEAAAKHAESFHGILLEDGSRPFSDLRGSARLSSESHAERN